jgi:hypothetical protein
MRYLGAVPAACAARPRNARISRDEGKLSKTAMPMIRLE